MSEEEKETIRAKDRERKRALKQTQNVKESSSRREFNKEAVKKFRKSQSLQERAKVRDANTTAKKKVRNAQSLEEKERSKNIDQTSKKKERDAQSVEERERSKNIDQASRKKARNAHSVEHIERSKNIDLTSKKKTRKAQSVEERERINYLDKLAKKNKRKHETVEQANKRKSKNRERMRKIRAKLSQLTRLMKFQDSVRYGPIFTCCSCEQNMFRDWVTELTKELKDQIMGKSSELYKNVFTTNHFLSLNVNGKQIEREYICKTCKPALLKGNMPSMCAANGLKLINLEDTELKLTELENNIIAKRILFQKIYQLPKSRMAACKDKLINIPINEEDVINSVQSLPRTPNEAGLLEVKLKRKMEYKNVHKQSYVDPKKIFKALEFLKNSGHPHYQFFDDINTYKERCIAEDADGCQLIFVDDNEIDEVLDIEVCSLQSIIDSQNSRVDSCQKNLPSENK